jgi:hypothetical protein
MIDRTHELPIILQCRILEQVRSTAHYQATLVRRTNWRCCAGSTSCIGSIRSEGPECRARHSSRLKIQSGTAAPIENTNRLLPQYLTKSTDLSDYTPWELNTIA